MTRCAVVRPVSPEPTAPSSSTMTDLPALRRRYAVVSPAIPAPTTQTSACSFRVRLEDSGRGAVAIQTEVECPHDVFMVCWPVGRSQRAAENAQPYSECRTVPENRGVRDGEKPHWHARAAPAGESSVANRDRRRSATRLAVLRQGIHEFVNRFRILPRWVSTTVSNVVRERAGQVRHTAHHGQRKTHWIREPRVMRMDGIRSSQWRVSCLCGILPA